MNNIAIARSFLYCIFFVTQITGHGTDWVLNQSNIFVPSPNLAKNSKIWVSQPQEFIGREFVKELQQHGYSNFVAFPENSDITNASDLESFFATNKPDIVFLEAIRSFNIGQVKAFGAQILYAELQRITNIIHFSHKYSVKKLFFLVPNTIYSGKCTSPLSEESAFKNYSFGEHANILLLPIISGVKLCQNYRIQYGDNFIVGVCPQLYGPEDEIQENNARIIPRIIKKIYDAKINNKSSVEIWGNSTDALDVLHSYDCARAIFFLMHSYNKLSIVNIGSDSPNSLYEICTLIATFLDYKGQLIFNPFKKEEIPPGYLSIFKMHNMGWSHFYHIRDGIQQTIEYFLKKNNKSDKN